MEIKANFTFNQIAYFVAAQLGRENDTIFIEEVKFSIKYWRAQLLRQDIEKHGMSPMFLQSVIVDMITVDEADNQVIATEHPIMRSKYALPEVLKFKDSVPLHFVGTIDKKKPYSYVQPAGLLKLSYSKFAVKAVWYSFFNNHLYLYGAKVIKYVRVVTPFVHPEEVVQYNRTTDNALEDDGICPIPLDIVNVIVTSLLNGTFALQKTGQNTILK